MSWSELVSSSRRTCECHLTITTLSSACVVFCKHWSSQKAKSVRREKYYFHPWLQSKVWEHCLLNAVEGGFQIPSSSSELSCVGAAIFHCPVMGTGQCKCFLPVHSSALALSNPVIPLGYNQPNSHGQASCWPLLRACCQGSGHCREKQSELWGSQQPWAHVGYLLCTSWLTLPAVEGGCLISHNIIISTYSSYWVSCLNKLLLTS